MTRSRDTEFSWLEGADPVEVTRAVAALHRVHSLIAAITDLDVLLERISEESRGVAGSEAASVMLYDAETGELYFHVALGDSGDQETLKREVRLKAGVGIAGAAAASRESILVADAAKDPRFYREADAASGFATRNLLAVPMIDRDTLVGVLEVVNKADGGTFSEMDRRVLEMFSAIAATSVSNARLIEERVENERMAAIGLAMAGLSHYTKNIVSGLNSSADLIDMGLEQENLDVLRRAWPILKRSTKRISNFVQDMLSFSKPRIPMRERCELAGIVREAHETFAELFVQRDVDISIDLGDAPETINVDAQGIYRCLLNLLSNAADAVPPDGGQIRVVARATEGGGVELRVDDNGPGVHPEHRARIFAPFYSTKGSKGTGLGLAVTRKIVEEHGGSIELTESPEGGASVRIVLPAAQESIFA